MRDCPYNKFDFKLMDEICELTGERTNGAIECSFDCDEDCEIYKRKVSEGKKSLGATV